jgi:hypothetical protein
MRAWGSQRCGWREARHHVSGSDGGGGRSGCATTLSPQAGSSSSSSSSSATVVGESEGASVGQGAVQRGRQGAGVEQGHGRCGGGSQEGQRATERQHGRAEPQTTAAAQGGAERRQEQADQPRRQRRCVLLTLSPRPRTPSVQLRHGWLCGHACLPRRLPSRGKGQVKRCVRPPAVLRCSPLAHPCLPLLSRASERCSL